MPKKFVGENTKAVTARARKAAVKEQEEAKRLKEIEDARWKEEDKIILRKQQRKEEKERKKYEQIGKKAENKALFEEDLKALKIDARKPNLLKITQAQIQDEMERKKLQAGKLTKVETHLDMPLEENINHQTLDGEIAETVTEAIAVLRTKEIPIDKHPERRLKSAFTAFEEENLPRLKNENPTLRLSQLKQMLRKEWMRSSENPVNQLHNVKAN